MPMDRSCTKLSVELRWFIDQSIDENWQLFIQAKDTVVTIIVDSSFSFSFLPVNADFGCLTVGVKEYIEDFAHGLWKKCDDFWQFKE